MEKQFFGKLEDSTKTEIKKLFLSKQLIKKKNYCPISALYASLDNNKSTSDVSVTLTLIIHPAPYGSELTLSGEDSNSSLNSIISPDRGKINQTLF